MSDNTLSVSPLNKTWLLDLDGTIIKHNGYKLDGSDTLLEGARALLDQIAPDDRVVFLTSRTEDLRERTEAFLRQNGIRFDDILYGVPYGERILINDKKPSGLRTAISINTERDIACDVRFQTDFSL